MSYILDALKRAEHERTHGRSTAADDSVGRSQGAGPRTSVLVLAGATLFLAGVALTALLLRPEAPAERPAEQRVTSALPTPPAASPRSIPTAPPAAAEPETDDAIAAEPIEGYESLDDVTPVFQGTVMATPTPPTVSARSASPPAQAPAEPSRPAATPSTVRLEPPPARPLREMPAAYRAEFPQLELQVHVYDTDPARRWVMVDGRRHGEGGSLPGGVTITEITAGGVVLEFRGERVYWPLAR